MPAIFADTEESKYLTPRRPSRFEGALVGEAIHRRNLPAIIGMKLL
jgi:hypothetical protein